MKPRPSGARMPIMVCAGLAAFVGPMYPFDTFVGVGVGGGESSPLLGGLRTAHGQSGPSRGPGVLIAPGPGTNGTDPRLGRLAGGFARLGLESFVAHDMNRPPPNAERPIIRGRWRTDDASRLRRRRRYEEATQAADYAIRLFESHAFEREHLRFLVAAYAERGAVAVEVDDPITAETMFLRAVALEPQHRLAKTRYPREARRLFAEVRRASRQLRYGTLRVDVPALANAQISVDFGPAREPPYETKLPTGRHFVAVRAAGRTEVVAMVSILAERRTFLELRPPTLGDPSVRSDALSAYDPRRPETIAALSEAARLRFVAVTGLSGGVMEVTLHDGATGEPLPSGSATLSGDPSPAEVDAAVGALMSPALVIVPDLLEPDDEEPSWYATWWGITLISLAVAAAATTTTVVLTQDGETEYRFNP